MKKFVALSRNLLFVVLEMTLALCWREGGLLQWVGRVPLIGQWFLLSRYTTCLRMEGTRVRGALHNELRDSLISATADIADP